MKKSVNKMKHIVFGVLLLGGMASMFFGTSFVVAPPNPVVADTSYVGLITRTIRAALQTQITANTNTLAGKQNTLVSGTTIKTINGSTLLGSGDMVITGSGGSSYTFSTGLINNGNIITNRLSTGVAGGQGVFGGTNAGDGLVLRSTTNATAGKVFFGNANLTAYDEVNNRFGIGTNSPGFPLEVLGTIKGDKLQSATSLAIHPQASAQPVVQTFHGLQIRGNTQTSVNTFTPANVGNNGDFHVMFPLVQTGSIGVLVRAAAGQTADIMQFQNSAGTVLSAVTPGGGFRQANFTIAQRDALTGILPGTTYFITDAVATDGSTGVNQTFNGSAWKNQW